MKKFLSLVLALVMTMSLVTVSAGAADFDDNGDIQYKEAVDVISALGIVDGYSDDTFRPDGSLTRGAAAKIICNLILGPTTADALSASSAPFRDVPTTNTFAGYITYCAQQGIISGYGDGTFRPTGSLTGNAFMKMLLGALGYDSDLEGYNGSNWRVNVIKQAVGIGLDDGNDSFVGSQTVTREEATLYAFNMLKATMVEYSSTSTVVVGDVQVSTSATRSEVENTSARTDGNIEDDGLMQFAERYFTDLVAEDGTDDFGRPSTEWVYDGDSVGTYANDADTTAVVDDSGKSVLDILADNDYMSYRDSDIDSRADVYINGDDTADLNDSVGIGDVVEAYEDDDGVVTTVVVRQYELARIETVDEDLSTSEERNGASVELSLEKLDGTSMGAYYDDYDDSDEVLTGYNSNYTEGAVLAVARNNGVIVDSYIADEVSGSISGYRASSITMDGTRYKYTADAVAEGADTDTYDFDEEYTVYLTTEGYVLGVDGATGVDIDDLYYVTGLYAGSGSYGRPNFFAQAVSLADGTVNEIELDVTTSGGNYVCGIWTWSGTSYDEFNGAWVRGLYTFDDGVPTAYETAVAGDYTVDSDSTGLGDELAIDDTRVVFYDSTRYYLDDTTQFLAVDGEADDIEVATATGGMRADDTTGAVYVIADGRDAVYVVLVDLGATMASDDVVYIAEATYDTIGDDQYEGEMWFMATGESDTVVLDKRYSAGFYKVSDIDEDGVYSLTQNNVPALTTSVESDDEGYQAGITIPEDGTSTTQVIYRDALSGTYNSVAYDDVVLANAVVIDARDNDYNYLYAREINSVSRLTDALEEGSVNVDLYVIDGDITFIAVTNSTVDPSSPNPGGGEETDFTCDVTVSVSGNNLQVAIPDLGGAGAQNWAESGTVKYTVTFSNGTERTYTRTLSNEVLPQAAYTIPGVTVNVGENIAVDVEISYTNGNGSFTVSGSGYLA